MTPRAYPSPEREPMVEADETAFDQIKAAVRGEDYEQARRLLDDHALTYQEHQSLGRECVGQIHTLIGCDRPDDLMKALRLKMTLDPHKKLRLDSEDLGKLSHQIRRWGGTGELTIPVLGLIARQFNINTHSVRVGLLFEVSRAAREHPSFNSPQNVIEVATNFKFTIEELSEYVDDNQADYGAMDERFIAADLAHEMNFEQKLFFVANEELARAMLPDFTDLVRDEITAELQADPFLARTFVEERASDYENDNELFTPILRDCWQAALSQPAGAEALLGALAVMPDAEPTPVFKAWLQDLMKDPNYADLAVAFAETARDGSDAVGSLNAAVAADYSYRAEEREAREISLRERLLTEWKGGRFELVEQRLRQIIREWQTRTIETSHRFAERESAYFAGAEVDVPGLAGWNVAWRDAVIRYAAAQALGDYDQAAAILFGFDQTKRLDDVVREGLRSVSVTQNIDLPLYEQLYEEFDAIQSQGERHLEVYLGRDGIYAAIGRQAAQTTRRQLQELADPDQIKLQPQIQYLVFTRNLMNNETKQVQRAYLAQRGVTAEANPVFYDTGFVGSIPENIMRLMGFSQTEIDERIRMLNAKNDNRRLRTLAVNTPKMVVQAIETNAKAEGVIVALDLDEETGEYQPRAHPVSPAERLAFDLIQTAIAAHFSIREAARFQIA